jgi:uncharacterized membrane protein YeaQ/YmgE (transglycosylase-associated protein family)
MDDFSDLAKLLGGLILLGALVGVGARVAMPGDQRMGFLKTVLYGIAGALIGGGIVELLDMADLLEANVALWALAGTLVAVLLIGALHQGGVLVPEDAVTAEDHEKGPAHQGHDLLDVVTRNEDGDAEREAAADQVELAEAVEAGEADVVVPVAVVHETVVVETPVDADTVAEDEAMADAPVEAAPADENTSVDAEDDTPQV